MKTASELTDFYYETLYPTLQELEKDRKNLRYRIVIVGVVFSLICLVLIFLLSSFIQQSPDILIFIGVGYMGIGGFIYKFLIKDYTSEFKQKVIKPLIGAIDSSLSYQVASMFHKEFLSVQICFHSLIE
ncbi:hypothetical protein [Sulfurimonas sp.]|uniref:hypothetical protein n=1 Tax=Sulfurimonas sp. TaxID=2022749 RepID=UPI002AAF3702|nr:hypothetical protein [Sulfurimonas sp.]